LATISLTIYLPQVDNNNHNNNIITQTILLGTTFLNTDKILMPSTIIIIQTQMIWKRSVNNIDNHITSNKDNHKATKRDNLRTTDKDNLRTNNKDIHKTNSKENHRHSHNLNIIIHKIKECRKMLQINNKSRRRNKKKLVTIAI